MIARRATVGLALLVLALLAPIARAQDDAPDVVAADAIVPDAVAEAAPDRVTAPDAEADAAAGSEAALSWTLERVALRGNDRTEDGILSAFVPFGAGDRIAPDDERLEELRYRLLGTGFFDTVELSFERGSARGRVVLTITVHERNTFLLEQVALGASEGISFSREAPAGSASGQPYFGVSVAEANLAGTGTTLRGMLLLSAASQGGRVRFDAPSLAGSSVGLHLSTFFVRAEEYFGSGNDVLVATPECPDPVAGCAASEESLLARLRYHRGGGTVGIGTSIVPGLRVSSHYRLEVIDVLSRPVAASELIGTAVVPIDFTIEPHTSFVSSIAVDLTWDDRDSPVLPTDGVHARLAIETAHAILGSSYDFFRAEGWVRGWIPLGVPWDGGLHTLRLGFFGGVAVGDVPFFARFYAADLSDLVPNRWLEVNLDRRATPNLLSNVIGELRFGRLAARVDAEYSARVFSAPSGLRSVWIYGLAGAYVLSDPTLLGRVVPGYDALGSFPIDLTFDVGLRLETEIGVFELGFSTLLGLIRP